MKVISRNPEETQSIAVEFVRALKERTSERATVIAFEGDLGSGKTAFSQFVGEALGVREPVSSPTFLIEKIYELRDAPWQHLIHIDAYRLDHESELLHLGWHDIINRPENLVLIEWAEKVPSILPQDSIRIKMTFIDETTREIEMTEAASPNA